MIDHRIRSDKFREMFKTLSRLKLGFHTPFYVDQYYKADLAWFSAHDERRLLIRSPHVWCPLWALIWRCGWGLHLELGPIWQGMSLFPYQQSGEWLVASAGSDAETIAITIDCVLNGGRDSK